ncbi:MAG: hypothetical protein ACRD6X_14125 [Pyrinomonadaceae bacterium]
MPVLFPKPGLRISVVIGIPAQSVAKKLGLSIHGNVNEAAVCVTRWQRVGFHHYGIDRRKVPECFWRGNSVSFLSGASVFQRNI